MISLWLDFGEERLKRDEDKMGSDLVTDRVGIIELERRGYRVVHGNVPFVKIVEYLDHVRSEHSPSRILIDYSPNEKIVTFYIPGEEFGKEDVQ